MFLRKRRLALIILLIFYCTLKLTAQNNTLEELISSLNILESNIPSEGYFFVSSADLMNENYSPYIAIIDNMGVPVFFRSLKNSASNFKLYPNGYLGYLANDTIFVMDSSFNYIDSVSSQYKINTNDYLIQSDNSKIILAYTERTEDLSVIIPGGNENTIVLENMLVRISSSGEESIIWNSEDVLKVEDVNFDSPYIDISGNQIDYVGLVDLVQDTDSTILLCCRNMDEITKVNLNTGKIEWRLGGKNNMFEFKNASIRFSQQSAIDVTNNGSLLVFDNGLLHDKPVSSVIEYELDEENMTIDEVNRFYQNNNMLVTESVSIQELDNGNMIIDWGNAVPTITELFDNGLPALEMDFSNHAYINKVSKHKWKTNKFLPLVDSINFGMWDYTVYRYLLPIKNMSSKEIKITSTSNFSDAYYIENNMPVVIAPYDEKNITIAFFPETISTGIVKDILTINIDSETDRISQQVKLIGYRDDFSSPVLTTNPSAGETNVPVNSSVLIDFGEPVRHMDNIELTYANIKDLMLFKEDNEWGTDVEYNIVLSSNKDYIRLHPINNLKYDQLYYIEILNDLKDYYNNILEASNFTFTTEIATKISSLNSKINVYPNPASHFINIVSNYKTINEIKLLDITGKTKNIVKSINSREQTIYLENLQKGLYIIKITFDDESVSLQKFLKL